jgi:hypothetical protein
MKNVFGLVCLVVVMGCATTGQWLPSTPDGRAVESAILWEGKFDERWVPLDMARIVRDAGRFEPQGNFYKVKGDLVVFGHPATYVGMLGVDLFAGPNAVLSGRPEDIAAYITQHHAAKFRKHGGSLVSDYKKDIKIIVEKYPDIRGSSIVIGAYTGP